MAGAGAGASIPQNNINVKKCAPIQRCPASYFVVLLLTKALMRNYFFGGYLNFQSPISHFCNKRKDKGHLICVKSPESSLSQLDP